MEAWSEHSQVNNSPYGVVNATMLSAVAAKDNTSATVEVSQGPSKADQSKPQTQVRMRQPYAQWRYKLDVIVDGRYIYFDR